MVAMRSIAIAIGRRGGGKASNGRAGERVNNDPNDQIQRQERLFGAGRGKHKHTHKHTRLRPSRRQFFLLPYAMKNGFRSDSLL